MKECCRRYLTEQFVDESIVEEIYGEYKASFAAKVEESSAALAAGDWNSLDRAAHTIKGNSLAAGDEDPAEVAISLRHAAKLHDAAMAEPLIARLKEFSGEL